MTRPFSRGTAEHVVVAVRAAIASRGEADAALVATFADITEDLAAGALTLAADIGLLEAAGSKYRPRSPLCRFIDSPGEMEAAAALRVALELYEPFVVFRERLRAANDPVEAAQHTKALLDLAAHREDIKDTMVSLGTFSQAIATTGGGKYSTEPGAENPLEKLVAAAAAQASAEARIREQLGESAVHAASRQEVILPLVEALIKAPTDPRGAVVSAGNSVESFLTQIATASSASLTGATGVNAKIDRLLAANLLPKKMGFVGKYLGHIRNAADHGVDADIGTAWDIRAATGVEYVFVACSFISAVHSWVNGKTAAI